MLWLPFAHRQGIWGPNGMLACAYLNDHVRLLKHYHVKCLMPALCLPLEFAYQIIPDPELSYTFLRRRHPVGVQTWLHLLKTFYRVWIPLPRIHPEHKVVQKTHKHRLTRRVFPCLVYLLNTSTELQHGTQLRWKACLCIISHVWHSISY